MSSEARSSRRSGPSRGPLVSTIRRIGPSSSSNTHQRSSLQKSTKPRNSARYRHRHTGHGGDFVNDDDAGREFENSVLEAYSPSASSNASTRVLPLQLQAQRDGSKFKLPKLSSMCLKIIADNFNSRIIPAAEPSSAGSTFVNIPSKQPRKGLLGLKVSRYDEAKDKDFVSYDDDLRTTPSKKRKTREQAEPRLSHNKIEENTWTLEFLPVRLSLALQELLEDKAPTTLTFETLSKYFLSREKVKASHIFRVLAIIGGVATADVVKLMRTLLEKGDASESPANILRVLHLQAFTRLSATQLNPILAQMTNLDSVKLAGCVNVTSDVVKALVSACGQNLKRCNFNWTSIGLAGLEALVTGAPNIEELKIAHVRNLNDKVIPKMMSRVVEVTSSKGVIPLTKLRRLKVYGTDMGAASVASLLQHCGHQLEALDIGKTKVGMRGFTDIVQPLLQFGHTLNYPPTNTALQKFKFTHVEINLHSFSTFCDVIAGFYALEKLDLGHFGEEMHAVYGARVSLLEGFFRARKLHEFTGSKRQVDWSTLVNASNEYLFDRLNFSTSAVAPAPLLHSTLRIGSAVCINENKKLFRTLNVSGQDLSQFTPISGNQDVLETPIRDVTSVHLSTDGNMTTLGELFSKTDHILDCEHLVLAHCKVPSMCDWRQLGVNGRLRTIDLTGTAVSQESVAELIKGNPFLESIDLTGCRAIPVRERRNYFETFKRA